jgi:protein phosphatase
MVDSPPILAAGASDVGKVREKNEDSFVIAKLLRTMIVQETSLDAHAATWFHGAVEGWLLVVADGMGGQGGGDVASRVAVQTITNYLCNVMPWVTVAQQEAPRPSAASLYGVREQLSAALTEGDLRIRDAAAEPGASQRMGTTLTLACMLWPTLYVAHAGDSRAYLVRERQLYRLTTDHTVAQQLIERGFPNVDETSHLNHILWNALGAAETELSPEVSRHPLESGDRVILCSDGLTKHVADDEILATVADGATPRATCDKLVALTLERGGSDNVTVVVAHAPA